ncbi:MAG: type II and III secretion system protein [Bacteroidetes bacterium]|nr:type II and III secretion system protein [Rhodothermia bacterium]MCS7155212.1 type II and III secretion system protein [Bacteroidota bacterium]MCX7907797.1 type II and III secretion system protein [Bacteroidota bacterium]MDW8138616.1 type II and III secretion system protein [Bacteroidota bacterium]MDW8284798.1 type II and III secretion system protein [Bacteroidota bacterium]
MMRAVRLQALLLGLLLGPLGCAWAQVRPPERLLRSYIPPEELVSFAPTTPFDQFLGLINELARRAGQKPILDPEERTTPIGVAISGQPWRDALELVLRQNRLALLERPSFWLLASAQELPSEAPSAAGPRAQEGVTLRTREVEISAVFFEVNTEVARELGINVVGLLSRMLRSTTAGLGVGLPNADRVQAGAPELSADLRRLLGRSGRSTGELSTEFVLRTLEELALGRVVANPQVTVQSGQKGEIQVGSDVPIFARDFAGNTITQFVRTGTIVSVEPVVVEDSIPFIHLAIEVERSSPRVVGAGVAVDKSRAATRALLLDGEETVIGGLFSTEQSVSRVGVPLLKDLPPWFFGLRYLFGYEKKSLVRKELVIVLRAQLLSPLTERRPAGSTLDRIRERQQGFRRLLEERR